jgi:hypothetical protein
VVERVRQIERFSPEGGRALRSTDTSDTGQREPRAGAPVVRAGVRQIVHVQRETSVR